MTVSHLKRYFSDRSWWYSRYDLVRHFTCHFISSDF